MKKVNCSLFFSFGCWLRALILVQLARVRRGAYLRELGAREGAEWWALLCRCMASSTRAARVVRFLDAAAEREHWGGSSKSRYRRLAAMMRGRFVDGCLSVPSASQLLDTLGPYWRLKDIGLAARLAVETNKVACVFLCGPPRAGKDTVASEAAALGGFKVVKFARRLDQILRAIFPMTDAEFRHLREQAKDEPDPRLGDKSLRWWYIYLSETVLKPNLGPVYFGNALLNEERAFLQRGGRLVVSDSGFLHETQPLVDFLGAGKCLQVRILREGCDFQNDSRGWWELEDVPQVELRNDGTREQLRTKVRELFENLSD